MAKKFLLERKRQEWAALLERLSRVELLRALPPEEMEQVLPYVNPVEAAPGDVVFGRGDPGDALYLIDQGRVDILRNGAAGSRLATLSAGDSFGEMALLSGEPRTATAVAVEPTSLLRIGRDDFDHLLAGSPALREAVEELNAQRVFQNVRSAEAPQDAEQWQRAARRSIRRMSLAEQHALMREAGEHGGAPLAIFLGALLDGIPESVVIGAGFTTLAAFNPTFLVAVFMSNLPEAMSSAAGMRAGGFSTARIFTLWGGLVVGSALAAALGNAVLTSAPPAGLAFVEAIAGGGILAMLASTMMPEAFEHGGPSVGLSTIAGFLSAFYFTTLELASKGAPGV
jgi:CRP-like cAMP-binding protein